MRLPGGLDLQIQVTGEDTGGAFTLLTDQAPAGWALPPHRHARESETIHVTRGALWLEIDGERRVLRAGDTAHIPAGTLHSGGADGDEGVERVVVFAPAGMERFFRALAGDPERALALAAEFGWSFGA